MLRCPKVCDNLYGSIQTTPKSVEDGNFKTLDCSSLGASLWYSLLSMTVFTLAGTPGMPLFPEGSDSCSLASSVRRWSQNVECES